jgi:hypothetical protein
MCDMEMQVQYCAGIKKVMFYVEVLNIMYQRVLVRIK